MTAEPTKRCTLCQQDLPLDSFYLTKKGHRHSRCLYRNRKKNRDTLIDAYMKQQKLVNLMGCTTETDLRKRQLILTGNSPPHRVYRVSLDAFEESGMGLADFILCQRRTNPREGIEARGWV